MKIILVLFIGFSCFSIVLSPSHAGASDRVLESVDEQAQRLIRRCKEWGVKTNFAKICAAHMRDLENERNSLRQQVDKLRQQLVASSISRNWRGVVPPGDAGSTTSEIDDVMDSVGANTPVPPGLGGTIFPELGGAPAVLPGGSISR